MSLSAEGKFKELLSTEIFNKVRGKSALAMLSGQRPVAFTGTDFFTFNLDKEADIVAENGAKSEGGATISTVTMKPIKFEYGARVSDEFIYASQERRIEILKDFADGCAKKFARALDIAAMHRLNPRTLTTAQTIPETNAFDSAVTNTVEYDETAPDENIEEAIALVNGEDGDMSGIAMSTVMRNAIAELKDGNGNTMYPDFKFGSTPENLGEQDLAVNNTVSVSKEDAEVVDHAIVGNFAEAFRWGVSKNIPLKQIEYGDPDNTGVDLAGHNQIYLRAEAYIGWAILDPSQFARIELTEE